jgi:hypothetical protein
MPEAPIDVGRPGRHRRWVLVAPIFGVGGALAVMAVIYLGYDIVKGKVSPCESIYQEASVGLTTKITFLKAEGELKLGREAVAELSDRAQMAALDLKTCCTVLDAGRIDPEQFLQCKAKSRAYDSRIDDIAGLLQAAAAGAGSTNAASVSGTITAPAPALTRAVEAARTTSQDFNRHVVQVVKEQTLQSLETAELKQLAIDSVEQEPNDDLFHANLIGLDKAVKAAIDNSGEGDIYSFTTPPTYRDWIRIEIKNQSTTLEPNLELFDSMKTALGSVHNATPGGDTVYEFVGPPAALFSVRVSSYYGQATGVYVIRVTPVRAYDAFEPNDDILSAKEIAAGTAVDASIMDKDDVDYFSVPASGDGERALTVRITNRSTTLHPNLVIYDASKSEISSAHNATPGGDLGHAFKVGPGAVYVRTSDYYAKNGGGYTLTVAPQ